MENLTINRDAINKIAFASRDEINGLQFERLKQTLQHAYKNSPFYHHKFKECGIHPDDFKTLNDLAKFPFTLKQDLRDHYPFGMFAIPQEEVIRIHASSGTTGKPTVVGYSKADIAVWSEVVARSMAASGVKSGDIVHIAYGYGLFTGGLGAHYGAEQLGCRIIPISGGMTPRQVTLIQDFKPRAIMVTPSYFMTILDEFHRQGLNPATTSLAVGIFGAEPWSENMRQTIESAFNINAVDIYGLSEIIGPGVSCESVETKDGPHIWEDHFYPEIINPETGEVVADGEVGELVFTSLTKQAMPIIRYRTRDLSRLLKGSSFTMRRMVKIVGRNDDMIILRGVNVFPSQLEEQILTIQGLSTHYQIVLYKDGLKDSMRVEVEPLDKSLDNETKASLAKKLNLAIKGNIGVNVQVLVAEFGSIQRSEGKAKRVIDQR